MTVKVFLENGQILTYHTSSRQAAEWLENVIQWAYDYSALPGGVTIKIED